jgi:hypothetical protein
MGIFAGSGVANPFSFNVRAVHVLQRFRHWFDG